MGKTFLVELVKIANELDTRGLVKEADLLDKITNNSLGLFEKRAGKVRIFFGGLGRALLFLGKNKWTWIAGATGTTGTGIGNWIGANQPELASAAGLETGPAFDTVPWKKSYDLMIEHLWSEDLCAGDGSPLLTNHWPSGASEQTKDKIEMLIWRVMKNSKGWGDDAEGKFEDILSKSQLVDDKTCPGFYSEEAYGQIFRAIRAQMLMEEAAVAVGVDTTKEGWLCDFGDVIEYGQDVGECPNLNNVDDWTGHAETKERAMADATAAEETRRTEEEAEQREDLEDEITALDAELGTHTDTDGLSVAELEGHLRRLQRDLDRVASEGAPAPADPDPGRDPFKPFPLPEPEPEAPSGNIWGDN